MIRCIRPAFPSANNISLSIKSPMKNRFAYVLLLLTASIAVAATPPLDVTVSDAAGKVAYRGQTGPNGTFSTPTLRGGTYVVQFNSRSLSGDHAVVVSAGKKKIKAESVSASQFRGGGVAMKVDVGSGLNITGQVAPIANG